MEVVGVQDNPAPREAPDHRERPQVSAKDRVELAVMGPENGCVSVAVVAEFVGRPIGHEVPGVGRESIPSPCGIWDLGAFGHIRRDWYKILNNRAQFVRARIGLILVGGGRQGHLMLGG
jgi:hypothetical protein